MEQRKRPLPVLLVEDDVIRDTSTSRIGLTIVITVVAIGLAFFFMAVAGATPGKVAMMFAVLIVCAAALAAFIRESSSGQLSSGETISLQASAASPPVMDYRRPELKSSTNISFATGCLIAVGMCIMLALLILGYCASALHGLGGIPGR